MIDLQHTRIPGRCLDPFLFIESAVFISILAILSCIGMAPRVAYADALVLTRAMAASTIAEIHVDDREVRIELEIGVRDLPAFQNLLPDELLKRMGVESPTSLKDRLSRFFREDMTVRADDGLPLPGYVSEMLGRTRIRRDEITGEPLSATETEEEAVVFAVLHYPLAAEPSTLHFTPPELEPGQATRTSIGFMTYHHGLPVMDFRYLGQEETLVLDWDDPWYSRFRNKNLWRTYNEPISAFLYVEPYEVRVEIIARPRDLQRWTDLGIQDAQTLPTEIQPGIKENVAAFLATQITLNIDGKTVQPALDRINFLRRSLRASVVVDPPEEMNAISATLGAIFVAPRTGLPDQASLTWNLFSPKLQVVRAAATDEAGPLPYRITPDDNVLVWKNFLKNPTIPRVVDVPSVPSGATVRLVLLISSAVIIGCALLAGFRKPPKAGWAVLFAVSAILILVVGERHSTSSAGATLQAEEVLMTLLKNLYVAFDFREEETIYDILASSVSGDLLSQVYLETIQSLELKNQGGARVRVKEVEIVDIDADRPRRNGAFAARCIWTVRGSVGHWGHIHQRINQYEAEIHVTPLNGEWRITGLDLLSEERQM